MDYIFTEMNTEDILWICQLWFFWVVAFKTFDDYRNILAASSALASRLGWSVVGYVWLVMAMLVVIPILNLVHAPYSLATKGLKFFLLTPQEDAIRDVLSAFSRD